MSDHDPLLPDEPSKRLFDLSQRLPLDLLAKLPPITDHIQQARHDCVIIFIEALLAHPQPITALDLQRLARNHKANFALQHPADFQVNFELIASTEIQLAALDHALNESRSELALAIRALRETLRRLIDDQYLNLILI